MNAPLVSIIIPCFNAEAWLAETLESGLAQTWPEKEIIVINDGSRDDSLSVARRFESRGVTVVGQPNRGASAARNHGLRLARGEFIQFLDADDLLAPGKIAAQMELLATRPAGSIASCAWGRFQDDPARTEFCDDAVFRDFVAVDFLVLGADRGVMMHPSAWLVPRNVLDRAGPWNESLTLNDDGEYFCRVLLAGTGVAFCPGPAARSFYRSGLPGSLSQRRGERARRSQFHSVELITAHLLATEDSARIRRAAANYYQRFIHDFFPFPADLMQTAKVRAAELGGATLDAPPMGPRTRLLASFIGWKLVWRLKHIFRG
jgi:glycosyltransferase involved in cell wall biosynthesis